MTTGKNTYTENLNTSRFGPPMVNCCYLQVRAGVQDGRDSRSAPLSAFRTSPDSRAPSTSAHADRGSSQSGKSIRRMPERHIVAYRAVAVDQLEGNVTGIKYVIAQEITTQGDAIELYEARPAVQTHYKVMS